MKAISAALAQHLAGEVTTLATCWKITRRDGVVLGFTDHVRDLEIDGVTYKAASGYTRTAIRSTADLAVDNLDVESVFSDDGITEEDLRTGKYDFAEVRMFLVNYENPAQGILKLRRGWLGEVTIRDGMYVAELRGMTQKLQMTVGEIYAPDCAADLGDARCGVDLVALEESGAVDTVISATGSAPAYRGLAYITFDELPLKDFGNRIPNITAEVVATASTVHPNQHLDLSSQGVDNWGKAEWRLDPERPYIYNIWGGWLLKINRVTGEVVYRVHVESDPAIVAWWQQNGWQGGPGLFAYSIDPVSGDLFIAFNGLSRTTFARLDPDTLQIKSWYRIGLFTPGPMLVYAGRYMACKSALAGNLVIIDFGNQIGGPTLAASVDYSSHSKGLALDPERARLYVLTESATGAEGWASWVDAAFDKHGSFHLEDDLGFPAGSAPSGITYDRASGRVIIGASTGLFACHPETLEIEQSLLGGDVGGPSSIIGRIRPRSTVISGSPMATRSGTSTRSRSRRSRAGTCSPCMASGLRPRCTTR